VGHLKIYLKKLENSCLYPRFVKTFSITHFTVFIKQRHGQWRKFSKLLSPTLNYNEVDKPNIWTMQDENWNVIWNHTFGMVGGMICEYLTTSETQLITMWHVIDQYVGNLYKYL
jgi:hypothetical protein